MVACNKRQAIILSDHDKSISCKYASLEEADWNNAKA